MKMRLYAERSCHLFYVNGRAPHKVGRLYTFTVPCGTPFTYPSFLVGFIISYGGPVLLLIAGI